MSLRATIRSADCTLPGLRYSQVRDYLLINRNSPEMVMESRHLSRDARYAGLTQAPTTQPSVQTKSTKPRSRQGLWRHLLRSYASAHPINGGRSSVAAERGMSVSSLRLPHPSRSTQAPPGLSNPTSKWSRASPWPFRWSGIRACGSRHAACVCSSACEGGGGRGVRAGRGGGRRTRELDRPRD